MKVIVFISLILISLFGCRITEDPTILYPKTAKRQHLDSLCRYSIIGRDTFLDLIWKMDAEGNVIYQWSKDINENIDVTYTFYNEDFKRTKRISFAADSSIQALSIWRYEGEKLVSTKYYNNIDLITDTFSPEQNTFYVHKKNGDYDTIFYFDIYDGGDTILDKKRVSYKSKKIFEIRNLRIKPDTVIYKYDILGRIKRIVYEDKKSKTTYSYMGNRKVKIHYYNEDKLLSSLSILRYRNKLLIRDHEFSFRKDSTIQEFICGVKEHRDTTIYDYSVKPTIYIYKYTKHK